ncbi:Acyl-CoA reductase [Parafrankia irregularis]|uniref:Acyl-CoA reductase n=1 Tax=Parafrankia irregularis TaxID=795642 RepID=A0A0S4QUL0_9ACTN|nr:MULTISPECIES: aldehyde dehydrogenase family protein [Parafrankia]MBE3199973.1 aldehyde dehydrogenase family protein [Parafrankia sp. CH37]CUU59281.1 Acyl-CoA reductase [Parafrankia irregularis]
MTDFALLIGGERRSTPTTLDVVNPATGGLAGQAPNCTRADLDDAMAAAQRAFPSWAADEDARRQALREAAAALTAAATRIGTILTSENGKPLARAVEEVHGVAHWIGYFAGLDLPRETIYSDATKVIEVVRRPMGVVAAIAPWNYPLILASWKLAPALRAGNTVVLKPSPFTPLSTLAMGEVLAGALPPGVLNVVSGGDELGAWMSTHPVPRKISFTGSVATGRKVALSAAADLKRVTLELGGNDPAILLDDIDVDKVADGVFASAFQNSGQVCVSIKRVYVPARLHADVVEALADRAKRAVVGDPMLEQTQLGPVSNAPQYRRVLDLIEDSLGRGAVAVAGGGALDGPGYFVAPTVLRDVTDGMPVVDEEQFGPVLPVVPYTDLDEVMARVNGSMYGLGGSVWSADPERAATTAERMECGSAWINSHGGLLPFAPFGGVKWSGVGVENGPWGLASYTDIQTLHRAL